MGSTAITIGKLAREAGVNVETIRYYERRGLVAQPPKVPNGFRRYPLQTVTRVRFIKRAQRVGFTLAEIAELLQLGDGHCNDARQLAERKYTRIEAQIADLTVMRKVLKRLIDTCRSQQTDSPCPLVESFLDPGGGNQPRKVRRDPQSSAPPAATNRGTARGG